MQAQTYLFFNGNCEEVMTYYSDVLSGEITQMMTFSDAPENAMDAPEEAMDLIMHSELKAGNLTLLASDYLNSKEELSFGNNFSISVTTNDEDQAFSIFESFADGGVVKMPFEETFWGGKFGMVKDKYDVNWMISFTEEHNA